MKKIRIALIVVLALVLCASSALAVGLTVKDLGNGKVECTVSDIGGFFELRVNGSLVASGKDAKTVTVSAKVGDKIEVSSFNGIKEVVVAAAATEAPTATPTAEPTAEPTVAPTEAPTAAPTEAPTAEPTVAPTEEPTVAPTEEPTVAPTEEPTAAPTVKPTKAPVQDDDVPKTGDTSYAFVVVAMMAMAVAFLATRKVRNH